MNDSPLSPAVLKEINQGLAKLQEALGRLDRAESAGLDVSAERAERDRLYEQLVAIKAAYFPEKR